MDVLVQLEQTGIARWVHESNAIYSYPLILFLHTLGMGLLVGLNAGIDFRILGFGREIPLSPLEKLFPIMWMGFLVNATTGTLLFISDATKHFSNPAFFVKLGFIALSLVNLKLIRRLVFHDPLIEKRPVQLAGKILALSSLTFWVGAITAGRLMAYVAEFL